MPARWQSSQRPMYVRTVFIDGFRHAILSYDDPYYAKLKRRPHSSASTTQYTKIRNQETRKLSLIITSDKSNIISKRSIEADIERLNLNGLEESEDFLVRANPQPIYDIDSSRSKLNSLTNMKTLRSNRTARSECKENTELSDRVLQWLDLAGKVDLLAPENGERLSQPRHSWPEIRRNRDSAKANTTADLRGKELESQTIDSARNPRCIDRRDYQVPSSAETIERYARQSRNKNTPRHETARNAKAKRDIPVDVLAAREKMIAERNAVERQYAELVSKKLISDSGKKKQVHIFMPEVPKNLSNITSRAESLLSQIS